jgi:excisionase family DNA binding protein
MTPNQLRLILADALDGASERLRAGIAVDVEAETTADRPSLSDPLPDVTEHVLRADDVARLLGVSAWSVYESIKAGEMPAIRVGRRILVPTHALRLWMSESAAKRV